LQVQTCPVWNWYGIVEFHLRLQFYSIPFLVETPSLAFSTHSLLKVPNSRIIPTLTFQFQSPDVNATVSSGNCLHLSTFRFINFSPDWQTDKLTNWQTDKTNCLTPSRMRTWGDKTGNHICKTTKGVQLCLEL